jgi:hypothetical protein
VEQRQAREAAEQAQARIVAEEEVARAAAEQNAAEEQAAAAVAAARAEAQETKAAARLAAVAVYYNTSDGPCEEPVTLRILAELLALAEIDWDTLVWSGGMGNWAKLEDCLHEVWADQFEDYFHEAIERATVDEKAADTTAVDKKTAIDQVKELMAEKNEGTTSAEETVEAKQESTTALIHGLTWS